MSYKTKFAGAAAAVVLATQVVNAQEAQSTEMADPQQDQAMTIAPEPIIPPEIRPFIGDLNVQFSSGIKFEDGLPKRTNATLNITGIECDFIEPLVEEGIAEDDRWNQMYGYERSEGEQAVIDSIRELFANRVFSFNETITGNDIIDAMGSDFGMLVPFDIAEEADIRIQLECSDYQAAPPSFTPVEPN